MQEAQQEITPLMKLILKILSTAFACWAAVVAWGVHRVTWEMDRMATRQEAFYQEFKNYVTFTESRLTRIEAEVREEQRRQARRDKEKLDDSY